MENSENKFKNPTLEKKFKNPTLEKKFKNSKTFKENPDADFNEWYRKERLKKKLSHLDRHMSEDKRKKYYQKLNELGMLNSPDHLL